MTPKELHDLRLRELQQLLLNNATFTQDLSAWAVDRELQQATAAFKLGWLAHEEAMNNIKQAIDNPIPKDKQ